MEACLIYDHEKGVVDGGVLVKLQIVVFGV